MGIKHNGVNFHFYDATMKFLKRSVIFSNNNKYGLCENGIFAIIFLESRLRILNSLIYIF